MLFLSSKLVFGNKLFFGKVDKSTSRMIPKTTFAEEVNNDNINFELAFYGRVHRASRLFAKDNQTWEFMDRNISRLLARQRLL